MRSNARFPSNRCIKAAMTDTFSRRDLLLKCAALGTLTLAPGASIADAIDWGGQQSERKSTPWDELGPFYKKNAPHTAQLRLAKDPGMPLGVSGQVFDMHGNTLEGRHLKSGRRMTRASMISTAIAIEPRWSRIARANTRLIR